MKGLNKDKDLYAVHFNKISESDDQIEYEMILSIQYIGNNIYQIAIQHLLSGILKDLKGEIMDLTTNI